jgi:hypothetical protein
VFGNVGTSAVNPGPFAGVCMGKARVGHCNKLLSIYDQGWKKWF